MLFVYMTHALELFSQEEKDRIRQLNLSGISCRELARQYGCSSKTVWLVCTRRHKSDLPADAVQLEKLEDEIKLLRIRLHEAEERMLVVSTTRADQLRAARKKRLAEVGVAK